MLNGNENLWVALYKDYHLNGTPITLVALIYKVNEDYSLTVCK